MTFAHVTTSTTRRGSEQVNASAVEQSRVTLKTMQMAEAIAAGAQSIKDSGGADEIKQSAASLIGSIERFVMWLAVYGLAAEAADPSVAVRP